MTAFEMPTRPSLADLLRCQLLPDQYQYPRAVGALTQADRTALLQDPFKPVARAHELLYQTQQGLLGGFSQLATDADVRMFALSLYELSTCAWDYLAACDKINYDEVPSAIAAGIISYRDGKDILQASQYWFALQLKVRPFVPSVT